MTDSAIKSYIWELFPYFILRSTGFPFEIIEQLGFLKTCVAIDTWIECEEAVDASRTQIQNRLRDGGDEHTIRIRRHIWKAVNKYRLVRLDGSSWQTLPAQLCALVDRWDSLVNHRKTMRKEALQRFDEELSKGRRSLRDIAVDKNFQKSIWLSSPQMFEHGVKSYLTHWQPNTRPTKIRRIERQLASYLQRFCAKNDTTAFFGPVNYGDFFQGRNEHLPGPGADNVQQHRGFIAYWSVQAIANIMGQDEEIVPYLCPFRLPISHFEDASKTLNIGRRLSFTLDSTTAQVLLQINGKRTVEAIASEVELSLEQTLIELNHLLKLRALVLAPRVPVTVSDPIGWLYDLTAQLPKQCTRRNFWIDTLQFFRDIQTRFGPAPMEVKQEILTQLEQRFEKITNQAARQNNGEFYADRLMIYEECLGGMSPLSLGPVFASELRKQLIPAIELLLAHACDVHQQLQRVGANLLTRWAPNGKMPFLDFIRRFNQEKIQFELSLTKIQKSIISQIQADADKHEIQIDPNMLPSPSRDQTTAFPLLTSPDVMLIASGIEALHAGDFQTVLSECHDTFMVWGWALLFHPERAKLEAAATKMLQRVRCDHQLANILTSRRVKILPFEYPGPTIEIMMPSSQKPAAERISAAELEVVAINGRISMNAPGWTDLKLYNGELHSLAHSIFALPKVVSPSFDIGRHTPRLLLGKTVLQRERWRLSRHELFPATYKGISFELMADFRRAVLKRKLPRYVYATIKGEPKPIFVDCENYFLVEMLHSIMSKQNDVLLVEMLPTPDQLWLKERSNHYCAELRLSACYVPPEP